MLGILGKPGSGTISPGKERDLSNIRLYAHGYYGKNTTAVYPATQSNVAPAMKRGMADIMVPTNWKEYAHCTWILQRINDAGEILQTYYEKFTAASYFATWVNANLGNDGSFWTETLHVAVIDDIDYSLDRVEIWGLNRAFGNLKGRRNFRSWLPKWCNTGDCAWDYLEDFISDCFSNLFSINIGTMTEPKINMGWFSQNVQRMWGIPKMGNIMEFANGFTTGRYFWNTTLSTPELHTGQDMTIGSPMYCCLTEGGNGWFWASGYDFNIISDCGCSIVIVFPLTNGIYKSLLIKPYCVDMLSISPYVDLTNFQIEYVTMQRDNTMRLRKADAASAVYDIPSNRFRGFNWSDWANKNKESYNNKGCYGAPDMYLQIRDLKTGKVSPLSNGVVKYYTKLRYRPRAYYVERNRK